MDWSRQPGVSMPADGIYQRIARGWDARRAVFQPRHTPKGAVNPNPPQRRIGNRIREVCELLERLGPCGRTEVADEMDLDRHGVSMYFTRAEIYGLIVKNGRDYTVVENWRDLAGPVAKQRPTVKPKPQPIRRVSSVWELGATV